MSRSSVGARASPATHTATLNLALSRLRPCASSLSLTHTLCLSLSHTRPNTRTHIRLHTRAHLHTYTRIHTPALARRGTLESTRVISCCAASPQRTSVCVCVCWAVHTHTHTHQYDNRKQHTTHIHYLHTRITHAHQFRHTTHIHTTHIHTYTHA